MAGCMRSTRLAVKKCSTGYSVGAVKFGKLQAVRLVLYYVTVQFIRFELFCKGSVAVC
jgi:hypothetical protein